MIQQEDRLHCVVYNPNCVFISREPFIILSGGLSYDTVGRRPCLTVMHGKSTAVLEMDYSIVDFLACVRHHTQMVSVVPLKFSLYMSVLRARPPGFLSS